MSLLILLSLVIFLSKRDFITIFFLKFRFFCWFLCLFNQDMCLSKFPPNVHGCLEKNSESSGHVLKPALILNILIISKMMHRVREIANPIRYDQQKFGKFLLRTDTSLVSYNRKLMRSDSFLTFFRSFVYAWLASSFSVFSQLAQVGFLGRRYLFLSVFQRKMKLKMTVGLCQPFFCSRQWKQLTQSLSIQYTFKDTSIKTFWRL